MTPKQDMQFALPDPPAPAQDARRAAVEAALARFDRRSEKIHQGIGDETRLTQQAAHIAPPRRRFVMPHARSLIAASFVTLMAGSAVWVSLDRPLPWSNAAQPAPEIVAEPKQSAPQIASQPAAAVAAVEPQQTAPRVASPPAAHVAEPQPSAPRVTEQAAADQSRDRREARLDAQTVVRQNDQAKLAAAPTAPAGVPSAFTAPPPAPATSPRASASQIPMRVAPEVMIKRGTASLNAPRPVLGLQIRPSDSAQPSEPVGRDKFTSTQQNGFKSVQDAPLSTFSLDVDTASYSFMRASLNRNALPQPAAVRTEELINYFPYAYATPASASEPFRTSVAVFPSPWSQGRKIIRIGIKGYSVQQATRPRANLVFLIDTSGSMNAPNRLPLVKQSLAMLVTQLDPGDRVAIVTYAGQAGTALEPTAVSDKAKILGVIENLGAGGSTAGAEGIRRAYELATRNFDANGVNRVVLATDGDFNVGITNPTELKGYIERERGRGIFLSVLGFGMGNYNDALMQDLAQNGNGNAAYIDTINEARKVLVEEATSTLFPIAKDVKIQVEFNPAAVAEYRLIGYETRLLNKDDFANDKVDAGEVGSGQSVTALYEIVPVGGPRLLDALRYAQPPAATNSQPAPRNAEYGFVKIRYKLPTSDTSTVIESTIDRASEVERFDAAPEDARFATSVAAFGEILRGGRHTGSFGYDDVVRIASAARGEDAFGYRSEFLQLVRAAKTASAMRSNR